MAKESDTGITARVIKRVGAGISGRIHWESSVSKTKISYTEAQEAQSNAGYSPLGYSFFDFSCREVDGGYQATWTCSTSCD